MKRLSIIFIIFLSHCSTFSSASKPPFGYDSYWAFVLGCAASREATRPSDEDKASDYLDQVYTGVRNDFNKRSAILEETEKSFKALGFTLSKETDAQDRTVHLKAVIDGDISFNPGRADLTTAALEIVDKFGDALAANPNTLARVHGHTDTPGSKEGNRQLSLRRAQSVRDSLIQRKKIARERITEAVGFADDRRIIQTTASEPRNRRTEILIDYKKE